MNDDFKNCFDKELLFIMNMNKNSVPKSPLKRTIVYIGKCPKRDTNSPTLPMQIAENNILILEIVGLINEAVESLLAIE